MTANHTILATAIGLALLASPAMSGGPVTIAEEPPVAAPQSSVGNAVVPLILIGVIAIIIASSGGGDDEPTKPEPCAKTGSGDC